MEMNRLTREADELIRKVVARYNSLYSASGTISQIELDLLLDDVRQMYDKFKNIGLINQQHQHIELPKSSKISPESSALIPEEAASPQVEPDNNISSDADTVKQEDVIAQAKSDSISEEKNESDLTSPEEIKENQAEMIQEDEEKTIKPEEAAVEQTVVKETPHQNAQTIADRFKNDHKSLSDVMASGASKEGSIGSRFGHSTVTDLKSVIGLAEKFAFINELFNGDPLAYEKAIVQLNGSSHLTEAETYLATLRLNHRWPADSPLVHLLYDMVRRKFSS